ncbi:MAG: nuclear transport factor 2 family protein [Acidobacteriota bacterium]
MRSISWSAAAFALFALSAWTTPIAADDAVDRQALIAEAEGFLAAFQAKDMERVGSYFAPGARVQRARLAAGGAPTIESFDAPTWLAGAGASIAGIQGFEIRTLDTAVADFGAGATVTIHFRATGDVGVGRFVNDGVDSFSFAQVDGAWKVLLYNSMEKLTFFPAQDDAASE